MFQIGKDGELELKLLQPQHAQSLFECIDGNREHIRGWLPWVDHSKSKEDSLSFIRSSLKEFADNQSFSGGIFMSGKLVGCIGLHRIDWNNRHSSIGYWLAADEQGKGIMTRACRIVVCHAFEELELNKLCIQARISNVRSRSVPERLGFQQEGVLRQHEYHDGQYHDHVLYSILRNEWAEVNAGVRNR
ncbi:GNAT family N-acetyltransferase [Marinicrinis lubricantis]|uniref:GNAT family N-acetyltransferase n=1 Tax=Marinicrinis lubricantis TaxID=2086470 RepID=A0ABW1IQC9_9BACL